MAVSLRLPPALKQRVARLVATRDTSAHAFMLEAIAEKLDAAEAEAAFLAEGEARLSAMQTAGVGVPADEVFSWLRAKAKGLKAKRPRARKIA